MNIFTLTGTILVDSAKAQESISKTGEQAEGLGSKLAGGIKTAAKWAAGVTAAAVAVGGAMIKASKDTAAAMDTVDKGAQRMKISTDAFQELSYAADLSGVSMSTLEKAAKKLEGTDLNFDEALDQIYALEDASDRAALAAELFGESVAYQMTPMLNASAEDMAAMRQEAHDLGLVMGEEAVKNGAAMNDMFAKVDGAISSLKNSLVSDFMPYVMEILQWVIDNMPQIQETVKSVMDAVWPIVKSVLDLIMQALPPLLQAIKSFLDWIMPYLKPIIDKISGVVEGVIALINGDVEGFVESVTNLLSTLISSLVGIGEDIFNSLWDGFKNIWGSITTWVSDKVTWLKDKLAFWRSGQAEMNDTNGSHAAGLPVVPYDGYVAELHRGETVMNAGAVSELTDAIKKLGSNQGGTPQPVSVQLNLDSVTLARLLVDPLKKAQQFNGGNYISMGGSAV
jgi:flagellar biosynthesis/type III secretory pathway protein FliH